MWLISFLPEYTNNRERTEWPVKCVSNPIGAVFGIYTADKRLLESLLHFMIAFWVNGGLTCLELSSEYLFTSSIPISEEGKRTQNVILFYIIQDHLITWTL